MSATTAYVGLGSNLDGPRAHVMRALEELARLPGTRLVRRSALYRSAPLASTAQPDYVNAVAQLETVLDPRRLLEELSAIEARHGRERPFPNAPRTLDLDLLLYGQTVLASPELTLPHPRMHERAFVLGPLAEIEPGALIPGRGRVDELMRACRGQHIERIA
ncbi:MAG TPA: 2-amino-4-hydroxy-6-hydroxymethyldihydropteridine diphosphokinase [Burkholderiales bacterium]|nr:2-amino-4-hydroxy-6-hydroxymethyldihydropteridine diphosphokinase [Burkholderiales bacterium]HYA46841.1 2-amino-4-hydroxy-6-hydroxymethyldihydropteridine diphosphokinase [Burkholderiales bacterium]